MLDSYLFGSTSRLCREAPVPVVNVERRTDSPGGAANTAANAAALGARVTLLSATGGDPEAAILRRALAASPVAASLVVAPERATLAKNRVVADNQILVRYDQGTTTAVSPAIEEQLLARLVAAWPRSDAVIVSDYSYGLLTPGLVGGIADLQARSPRVLLVDSRRLEAYRSLHPTAVKPNREEVEGLLSLAVTSPSDLPPYGGRLFELTGADTVAVTLDRDGALLFEQGAPAKHLPTPAVSHAHVAGAGDTFTAALALGLAAGCGPQASAALASAAAAFVVGREGTTVCSAADLRDRLTAADKYVTDCGRLVERLALLRARGRRIVFTNGCFDILHSGHIGYLNAARGPGDVLVVGLNSDTSVRRLKGPERPVNTLADRARVLSALSCVDFVVPFDADTPADLIRAIRPELFVKGADYSGRPLPEAALVESLGGRVQLLPFLEDHSTTRIIARIRDEQAARAGRPEGRRRSARRRLERRPPGPLPQAG
ncbi:MAG: D-glycero-beta-D-manno-heptose 1-phosphate adenylyltransferase [Dehalococcoidia bacterium]|nr:D-glycero-beta-D-manno-heptose 1-phosphate adenylyltransferase [Dehalococcoidia bacterium]